MTFMFLSHLGKVTYAFWKALGRLPVVDDLVRLTLAAGTVSRWVTLD